MNNQIKFNNHHINVIFDDGMPHLCSSDIAKACGYKSSISSPLGTKQIVRGNKRYIPVDKIDVVARAATGTRRELMQELLDVAQREFVSSMPVQSAPLIGVSLDSGYQVAVKRIEVEKELINLQLEMLSVQAEKLSMEVRIKDLGLKVMEREHELQSISPSNVVSIARAIGHE